MTNPSIAAAVAHANNRRDEIMDGFKELLRIPSISTDPAHKADLEHCADWIITEMDRIGFKNNRKIATDGHPVVYGEWLEAGPDKPTVVVYAHYDVQPVVPLELWTTPPFEPNIRDGKLYARGSIDDKCGVWINLKAFEAMFAVDGKLPVNVKLFFEGEEEMGSPNVHPFISANTDLLRCDGIVLSDGWFKPEQPEATSAARGMAAAEVTVTGPDHDLHSGVYGGAIHNPLHVAGQIIGSFHDASGRVQIPGFYDRVRPLDEAERKLMAETWPIIGPEIEAGAGTSRHWASSLGSFYERTTALPTLDVNGMIGGYTGPGLKTIIPSQASFKVTMRLVADQDPDEIGRLFTEHVQGFATDTCAVDVKIVGGAWPFAIAIDGFMIEAERKTFQSVLGKDMLVVRGGGTLPIGGTLDRELGVPQVSFGFGAGENVHAPNEYIVVDHFYLGIETAIHFFYNLADGA